MEDGTTVSRSSYQAVGALPPGAATGRCRCPLHGGDSSETAAVSTFETRLVRHHFADHSTDVAWLLGSHGRLLGAAEQFMIGRQLTACGVAPFWRSWHGHRSLDCPLCRGELFMADAHWLAHAHPEHVPTDPACGGLFAKGAFFATARDIFHSAPSPQSVVRRLGLTEQQREECWWLTTAWREGTWPRRLGLGAPVTDPNR